MAIYYGINNDVFLSIASAWEMQIKHRLGKLYLDLPLSTLIEVPCIINDLQILAIETQHFFALADLQFHHKAPFYWLILSNYSAPFLKKLDYVVISATGRNLKSAGA